MSQSSKTEQEPQTGKRTTTNVKEEAFKPRWNVARVFWGLLFLLLGVVALLDSFDVLEVNFFNLWKLWPLAIVALGLNVLSLSGSLKRLVMALFIIATLAGALLVVLDTRPQPQSREQTADIERMEAAEKAKINFKGGAGDISIGSLPMDLLATVHVDSNFTELMHEVEMEGDQQLADIRVEGNAKWWYGDWQNDIALNLAQDMPLELLLDTGAANINGDLSQLELHALSIDSGASSVDLKLGNKTDNIDVRVDAGASSVELDVPESSGVRVELERSLGSLSLSGLDEVEEGVYATEGYESAEHQITVEGEVGAASFDLNRY